MPIAIEYRDYDARGNQTQDDRDWFRLTANEDHTFSVETYCQKDITRKHNDRGQLTSDSVAFSSGLLGICGFIPGNQHTLGIWKIPSHIPGDTTLRQTYDREGNLRLRAHAERTSAVQTALDESDYAVYDFDFFYYNAEGRLVAARVDNDPNRSDICASLTNTTYEYDGFDRRIRKRTRILGSDCGGVVDKVTTYDYVYDGDFLLYERITEEWPNGPTNLTEILYTRTLDGRALSRHIPGVIVLGFDENGDTISFNSLVYHVNSQNTPIAATDLSGERYQLPRVSGPTNYRQFIGPGSFLIWHTIYSLEWYSVVEGDQGVSYAGQPFDVETGLHYFRNRYYDGRSGRFTQEDPIGFLGGYNLYAYAGNNPVNFSDPFGLCERPTGLKKGLIGICIEAYIQGFGLGAGDKRGPSPSGGTFKTTARFTYNPATREMSKCECRIGKTFGAPGLGAVSVGRVGDGQGGSTFTATGGARTFMNPLLADINFNISVHVSPDGTVVPAGGSHDAYPSYEVWVYYGDGRDPELLYEFTEEKMRDLFGPGDDIQVPDERDH